MIKMLANVQQQTIKPIIQTNVTPGTLIYTDEYNIYDRLEAWGYSHQTVCHSAGEYARDDEVLVSKEDIGKMRQNNPQKEYGLSSL